VASKAQAILEAVSAAMVRLAAMVVRGAGDS